jgi:hypothetical protein
LSKEPRGDQGDDEELTKTANAEADEKAWRDEQMAKTKEKQT